MNIRPMIQETTHIFTVILCFSMLSTESFANVEDSLRSQSLTEQVIEAIDQGYGRATFSRSTWDQEKSKYLLQAYESAEDEHHGIRSLLSVLNEPSVRVLKPLEKEYFLQEVAGKFSSGIGLLELLSVDIDERTGLLTIVSPFPNTAAYRAGLRSGDQILAIDKVRTSSLSLTESMAKLRGEPGSTLSLEVNRGGKVFPLTITREAARSPTNWVKVSTQRKNGTLIGHIQYRFVAGGSSENIREELTKLVSRGVDSIILDLRNNPGGALADSISISDLFLPKGAHIATLQAGKNKVLQKFWSKDKPIWDGPLVVLQNKGTASAAELISGSLQANARAFVIGQKSFGKGLVHTLAPLSDGSAVLFQIGRLSLANGRDILHEMIEPDQTVELNILPLTDGNKRQAENPNDLQYLAAVKRLEG